MSSFMAAQILDSEKRHIQALDIRLQSRLPRRVLQLQLAFCVEQAESTYRVLADMHCVAFAAHWQGTSECKPVLPSAQCNRLHLCPCKCFRLQLEARDALHACCCKQ